MPPAACQVEPAVSSLRSTGTTSVQPSSVRWYRTEAPTTPPPMTTTCAEDFIEVPLRLAFPGTVVPTIGRWRRRGMGKLLDRLAVGPVICAEGYLFECERRGYLQAGAFVPEVVLEEPDMVAGLHREYVHAGSDVVEAFTYYAHREKLAVIGREGDLERLNREALRIAKEVGAEHDSLVAGNICNTNVYDPDDPATHKVVRDMFTEQVGWAAEAGVDFVIAETIDYFGEALLAIDAIKAHGLDAVVTLSVHRQPIVLGGGPAGEACPRLQDAGADVVGRTCP